MKTTSTTEEPAKRCRPSNEGDDMEKSLTWDASREVDAKIDLARTAAWKRGICSLTHQTPKMFQNNVDYLRPRKTPHDVVDDNAESRHP